MREPSVFAKVSAGICRPLALAAGLSLHCVGSLHASAYLYPPGEGQVIVTALFTQAWRAFDTHGTFIATSRFQKIEASVYLEYGLTDWLTLVVQPDVQAARFASGGLAVNADAASSSFGGRMRLWTWKTLTVALQTDAHVGGPRLDRHTGFLTDSYSGLDMHVIADLAFSLGRWPAYLDADAGYEWRLGAAPGEWQANLSLGVRPRPAYLVLIQSLNTWSDGAARQPFVAYRESKLETSLVYDWNKAWSVQMGLLSAFAGVNSPAELGGVMALWRRF